MKTMKNNPKKISGILMSVGLLLIVAALALTCYNYYDERRAESNITEILSHMTSDEVVTPATQENQVPDYVLNPDMKMPETEIDGHNYIGVVSIPKLNVTLPVMSELSNAKLKIAPCRYKGSAYSDDMILAAHNYRKHFGSLKMLEEGDKVFFTDTDNNVFTYEVKQVETLGSYAVEEMQSGEWDLTLFTCTIGGRSRVTVRCNKVN